MKEPLRPGLTARLEYVVPAERTVPHLLPEAADFTALPEVLATGYMVGIAEWACIRAAAGHLDAGEQTLAVHVDGSHDAPTPPGAPVTVEVEVTGVEGRQLTFAVQARDDVAVISRGTHRRAGPGFVLSDGRRSSVRPFSATTRLRSVVLMHFKQRSQPISEPGRPASTPDPGLAGLIAMATLAAKTRRLQ